MGYSGAVYVVQEVCNGLFDALFSILPNSAHLDQADPTPAANLSAMAWQPAAKTRLDELVETYPVLTRISAAKALRDAAEEAARQAGEQVVSTRFLPKKSARESEGEVA